MGKTIINEYSVDGFKTDHAQYYPGATTAFTSWNEVYVGSGTTPAEALEDALDSASDSGWDVSTLVFSTIDYPDTDVRHLYDCTDKEGCFKRGYCVCNDENERYYYVELYIK